MATAEQLKALIRSHFEGEAEKFSTAALQLAAHEARQGHTSLAYEIRGIIEKTKRVRAAEKFLQFPDELRGLVVRSKPQVPLVALVVPSDLQARIDRIIHEYRQQHQLKKHGLSHRRKILLIGAPGTGKTMSVQVLAHEIDLPLCTIQVDRLVTKFMGETAAKLRQIFDLIGQDRGVYLFDEFDAIGGARGLENDVGEMRRVLSAFLQFIENDTSDSLIVAATNTPRLLDRALFRRFEDVLHYDLPAVDDRIRLVKNLLGQFLPARFAWDAVVGESEGLSHADVDSACRDAIKQAILSRRRSVSGRLLCEMLAERRSSHFRREN